MLSVAALLLATIGIAKAELDFNDTFPVSFDITNECTGEKLLVMGEVHFVETTVEKEDGTSHYKQYRNFRGWAVGMDTGDLYRFNNNVHYSEVDGPELELFRSSNAHARLIGKGKTPNVRVVFSFLYERDVDGNVTNVTVEEDVICQDEDE